MSVLLRQPHGFEGLGSVIEVAVERMTLRCSQGPHLRVLSIDLDPACLPRPRSTAVKTTCRRHRGDRESHPRSPQRLGAIREKTPDAIMAVEYAPVLHPQRVAPHVPLNVRVVRAEDGLIVASPEGVEDTAHDLHVLLRHRPRSIAQAQESASVLLLQRTCSVGHRQHGSDPKHGQDAAGRDAAGSRPLASPNAHDERRCEHPEEPSSGPRAHAFGVTMQRRQVVRVVGVEARDHERRGGRSKQRDGRRGARVDGRGQRRRPSPRAW